MDVKEVQLVHTVGELKKYLEKLPDDMKLLIMTEFKNKLLYTEDVAVRLRKHKIKQKKAYDYFDYSYTYDDYIVDESGEEYLVLGD